MKLTCICLIYNHTHKAVITKCIDLLDSVLWYSLERYDEDSIPYCYAFPVNIQGVMLLIGITDV